MSLIRRLNSRRGVILATVLNVMLSMIRRPPGSMGVARCRTFWPSKTTNEFSDVSTLMSVPSAAVYCSLLTDNWPSAERLTRLIKAVNCRP